MTTIRDRWDLGKTDGEIGIEVEVEGTNLPTANMGDNWNVARDGSLRGNGFEYQLYTPVSRKRVAEVLSELENLFGRAGATVLDSPRAGVHIHVNCQTLTERQVFNIAVLYLIFEKLMINYCGDSRKGNLFCLSAEDAEGIIVGLTDVCQRMSLSPMMDENYRYASLNLTAIQKFGSVEFRSLQTPQNFLEIETWVKLLLKIKDAALEIDKPRDIVEGLSRQGAHAYMETVFGDMAKYLFCNEMDQWLMEGVRRVQLIAYKYSSGLERSKRKRKSAPKSDVVWTGLRAETPIEGQLLSQHGNTYRFTNHQWQRLDNQEGARAVREAEAQARLHNYIERMARPEAPVDTANTVETETPAARAGRYREG